MAEMSDKFGWYNFNQTEHVQVMVHDMASLISELMIIEELCKYLALLIILYRWGPWA